MAANESNRWLTSEARAVDAVLTKIDEEEKRGSRTMRGDVSVLRRMAGRVPGEDARSTAVAIRLLSANGLPLKEDVYVGKDGLTNGERAAVISLALSAAAPRMAHVQDGRTFGGAFAEVVYSNENLAHLMKAITCDEDLASLTYNLFRALRQFGDVQLDYGQLTNDLIKFQNPSKRKEMMTKWVKDYYYTKQKINNNAKKASSDDRRNQ